MKWRQFGWVVCAGAVGLLAGCVATPTKNGAATAGVDGLYAQLNQATQQYDQALDLARRGDNAQSQKTLGSALDAMRAASDRCSNTSSCDTQRFLSAYDRALRLKDGSFLGTENDDDVLDIQNQNNAATDSGVLTTLPQAQRTVALLHDHKLSELVATNGPVQAALQVWLTRLRPNLVRAYVDYQYLRYEMWPAYHNAGLPEAILFGILAKESGGRVHAVSRSGAAGPLQFMPATGARFGLSTINGFDQRFDPTMSAQANAAYLDEQMAKLNDNLALVLAAYNGGEGRVGRLVASTPNASFWDPNVYFALSPETRAYVPMVLAAAWLFLHPHRYNLHFPAINGTPGHVDIARAASLNELSVCLGDDDGAHYGWYRTLRNLNPQMDPTQVQPQGTRLNVPHFLEGAYRRSCRDGRWVALANQLQNAQLPTPPVKVAAADPPPRHGHASVGHYTVRKGDTLSAISRRFNCDGIHQLIRSNHLHSASDLRIGKRLQLTGCKRR